MWSAIWHLPSALYFFPFFAGFLAAFFFGALQPHVLHIARLLSRERTAAASAGRFSHYARTPGHCNRKTGFTRERAEVLRRMPSSPQLGPHS